MQSFHSYFMNVWADGRGWNTEYILLQVAVTKFRLPSSGNSPEKRELILLNMSVYNNIFKE